MEVDRAARVEAALAGECFSVDFVGDAHRQVYRQVLKLREDANISMHYSPYSPFVQSSCVGKTRCVLEMSTLGVYICYCSLAGKDSSAYPPRTEFLADRLAESFTELEMVLYLNAWVLVLAVALEKGTSAVEWKDRQLPGSNSGIAQAVREKWEELIASHPAKGYEEDKRDRDLVNGEIMNDALERVQELLDGDHDDEDMDMDRMDSDSQGELVNLRVIFVFDEARGLTLPSDTPFSQLRRALRVFFVWTAYFALLLDTTAKVSNILPRKSDEDSSRALKIGISLLPPIYYLPTLQLNMPKPGLSVVEYSAPSTWMKYGRPVWAARMAREGQSEVVLRTKLLPWAQQKLMGGEISDEFAKDGKMTESQAMALLAAATGLQVCPRCPLAEKLAASHMNLVLRVTRDRSRVFVALPAEPILSEAAAGLLRSEKVKQNALMHMEAACLAGYATGGPRGEFVAKFILAAAVWDLAKAKQSGGWYLRPIKVRDFFRTLLVNNKRDITTKEAFSKVVSGLPAGGLLFFHSFVVVGKVPDTALLCRCFAGGLAIMYQADNNMPGANLILPIWTPQGMTCCVVSVKNQSHKGWWEGPSLEFLKSEFTKLKVGTRIPIVIVLMSMREPAVAAPNSWILWDGEDKRYLQLTCYGLDGNYGYLSMEVRGLLRNILVTRPDPLKDAEDIEAEWIKKMLPYQYEEVPDFVVSLA
ncbi:hypothetical protein SELMODRAFT_402397 [Selaginella moellendorffii]|uniref:Uncharacterized protein n=1 Tax=Selaginella moellendorffii TaxID=88036 RepID=D8QQH8_SELML|nr:hypothetical protein SELMODRAFT_402397 [Selaginella moellendorffii]